MPERQDLDYIARMYASSPDPWRIGEGFYERRKRDVLLSCLPAERYRNAFEPACAGGELTVRLAERCDRLLACDVAEAAVGQTAARLADKPWVQVRRLFLPAQWPVEQRFDLVVLSEFGYFLPEPDWQEVVAGTAASLAANWTVLACHWRHDFARRLQPTDRLHELLHQALPGRRTVHLIDEDFRLEVWTSAAGVASAEGLG
jgi:hypothetical protein